MKDWAALAGRPKCSGDVVSGLLVEVVVGEAVGVHAGVGDEDALEPVEDEEERLAVEGGEQLVFALAGFGVLLYVLAGSV